VVVEARDAQADPLGDVAQRRPLEAALGEQRLGRVEDALGGALALAARAGRERNRRRDGHFQPPGN